MIISFTISMLFISAASMILYFNSLSAKQQKEIQMIIEAKRNRTSVSNSAMAEPGLAEAV